MRGAAQHLFFVARAWGAGGDVLLCVFVYTLANKSIDGFWLLCVHACVHVRVRALQTKSFYMN